MMKEHLLQLHQGKFTFGVTILKITRNILENILTFLFNLMIKGPFQVFRMSLNGQNNSILEQSCTFLQFNILSLLFQVNYFMNLAKKFYLKKYFTCQLRTLLWLLKCVLLKQIGIKLTLKVTRINNHLYLKNRTDLNYNFLDFSIILKLLRQHVDMSNVLVLILII